MGTETIILSNSTRMPKGRRKKADTASRRHRAKKKEQRRGGTKEDKSLRGTTKLVRVIPVIKTNSRQRTISKGGHATTRRDKQRRQKEENEESKDQTKRITQQQQHQNNEAPTARCGILFKKLITRIRNGDIIIS